MIRAGSLSTLRCTLRTHFPFAAVLVASLVLMAFYGRSLTDNFVYLALLLPFVLAATADDGRSLARNPVIVVFALYLLALWFSLLGSEGTTGSIKVAFARAMIVELAFVACVAWIVALRRPQAEIVLGVGFGAVVAAAALFSLWTIRSTLGSPGVPLIVAPWPNQNTGAIISAVMMLILTGVAYRTPSRVLRAVAIGLAVILSAAIVLSGSRNSLLSTTLALLGASLVLRRWTLLAGAAIALAGIVAAAVLSGVIDVAAMLARGDASRIALWQFFIPIARENWCCGIGINREFSLEFPLSSGRGLDNPHNMFIASALYGGLPALFGWVALMLTALGVGFDAARRRGDPMPLMLALLLALYGLFESVMLTSRPGWQWIVYLVPIGLIAGAWSPRQPSRTAPGDLVGAR